MLIHSLIHSDESLLERAIDSFFSIAVDLFVDLFRFSISNYGAISLKHLLFLSSFVQVYRGEIIRGILEDNIRRLLFNRVYARLANDCKIRN